MRCAFSLLLAAVILPCVGSIRAVAQEPPPRLPRKTDKIQADKGKRADLARPLFDLISGWLSMLPAEPSKQPEPPRYKEFQPPDNLKAALEARLKQVAAERDILKSIETFKALAKWSDDDKAKMLKLIEDYIQENRAMMSHPEFQKAAKSHPELQKLLEKMQQRRPAATERNDAPDKSHSGPGPSSTSGKMSVDDKLFENVLRPANPGDDDEMMRLLREWAEQAETSGLGRYLVESPAWRDLMRSLREGGRGENASRVPFNGMAGRFGDAARDLWRPEWSWRPKIGKLPVPDLGNWRPPPLSLPGVHLPGFSAPGLGTPSIPSGPPTNFQALGWLLLVVVAGALLWMWKRTASRPAAVPQSTLGDWPVAPDKVSTRGQLIHAFDYLAQLRLGQEAVYWNHRRIANQLGQAGAPHGEAARRLAGVYEAVRYADGPETLDADLSQQQRDAVRLDLCLLAKAS